MLYGHSLDNQIQGQCDETQTKKSIEGHQFFCAIGLFILTKRKVKINTLRDEMIQIRCSTIFLWGSTCSVLLHVAFGPISMCDPHLTVGKWQRGHHCLLFFLIYMFLWQHTPNMLILDSCLSSQQFCHADQ